MVKNHTNNSESAIEWRSNCPVSCSLDILGDKWTLLIVRDLFIHGTRTYSEFCESPEKISTNILANRLKVLDRFGLIRRLDPDGTARGNAYQLTTSGEALRPVVLACSQWAGAHLIEFNRHIIDV